MFSCRSASCSPAGVGIRRYSFSGDGRIHESLAHQQKQWLVEMVLFSSKDLFIIPRLIHLLFLGLKDWESRDYRAHIKLYNKHSLVVMYRCRKI